MDFVQTVDCDVPEYFVSGVARVTQLGAGTVRITFYSTRETANGEVEHVPIHHQVWDKDDWLAAAPRFRQARQDVEAGAIPLPSRPRVLHGTH